MDNRACWFRKWRWFLPMRLWRPPFLKDGVFTIKNLSDRNFFFNPYKWKRMLQNLRRTISIRFRNSFEQILKGQNLILQPKNSFLLRDTLRKGTPLFFHDFQISVKSSPIWLKFLLEIEHRKWRNTCSRKFSVRTVCMGFYRKNWFSSGLHLDNVRGGKKSSDWTENCFGGTYRCISEIISSVFGNLASFSFYKKNTKRFSGDPVLWHEKLYKSRWRDRKWRWPKLPLRNRPSYLW